MFVMLLVATGQWVRIVPGSWDNLHNAASAFQQYASLQWPLENCWVNDNALQVLSYFAIVFIAAPLALLSGLRRSPAWPKNAALNKAYPLAAARAVHVPVMVYFVAFVAVHVTLARTPIGSYGGALKDVPAHELGATAARAAIEGAGIAPSDVAEVIMGCIGQVGPDAYNARRVALAAGGRVNPGIHR